MFSFLKKDSYWLGAGLATIVPMIVFFILRWSVDTLSEIFTHGYPLIRYHNVILFSVFLNMVIFAPYLHRKQYDKNGRGVMIVTFIMTVVYFIWRYQSIGLS